jgi:hypothetical protein
MQGKRFIPLERMGRRYQRAEDAGHRDVLLAVVFIAGGLATGGVVLLAFVQTRAILVLSLVLVVAATLAVLATIGAMLNADLSATARPHGPEATGRDPRPARSPAGPPAPPAPSRGARGPR